jgi:hypothetical protein
MSTAPDTTPEPAAHVEPDTGTTEPATEPDEQPVTETEPEPDDDTTRAERRRPRTDERYREQLRTVEAQRDRLQERVDAHDRAAAERDVSGILLTPGDLWCGGIAVDDCRDEDGNYSRDFAIEAAKQVAKAHPNWAPNPAAPTSVVGWGASKPEMQGSGNNFTDAFRPPTR